MTVEPGIYIPEEGFAVRLENDVLITNEGPVDLMADIPIEADQIESLMNGRPMMGNGKNGRHLAPAKAKRISAREGVLSLVLAGNEPAKYVLRGVNWWIRLIRRIRLVPNACDMTSITNVVPLVATHA